METRWSLAEPLVIGDTELLVIEAFQLEGRGDKHGAYVSVMKQPLGILVCREGRCVCLSIGGESVPMERLSPHIDGLQAWLDEHGYHPA